MKKRFTWRSLWVAPTLALALMLMGPTVAQAVPAIGLTIDNQLVRFDTDTPQTIISTVPITGLQTGEFLHGIDFRTATGELYGLGSRRRIYRINPLTGVAMALNSAPFVPALTGSSFGFDFNPTVDRIRVTSNRDENFRFHPDTGAVVAVDTPLAYAVGDPNEGADPNVVGAAYSNNIEFTPPTTLYGIDYVLDTLVRIGGVNSNPSPNGGQLTTIGPLGVNASQLLGFDIAAGTGTAFAVFRGTGGISRLYKINLNTGQATLVGPTTGVSLRGLSIIKARVNAFALSDDNDLLFFSTERPGVIINRTTITGLQPGETILAIDISTNNFEIYGLGSTGRLYRINGGGVGTTQQIGPGPVAVPLNGTSFGFDFNPLDDLIRVTSDAEQNFRINRFDGTVIVDMPLAYAANDPHAGANPSVGGSAYTNNISSFMTTATTLYGIDTDLDILVRQGGVDGDPSPDGGELNTVGNLGINAVGPVGFDVATKFETRFDFAYAAITGNGGISRLYTINLATGKASFVGIIGGNEHIIGLAVRF
jgi:hypothetical protein